MSFLPIEEERNHQYVSGDIYMNGETIARSSLRLNSGSLTLALTITHNTHVDTHQRNGAVKANCIARSAAKK